MSAFSTETVTSVHHWTDTLFSFTTTRDPGLRFLNGQFAMIGLEVDGRPLLRAYSMVSSNHEDQLEFLSIKVPSGPLTSRLQHIRIGDGVLVGRKPTGTIILDNLTPAKHLYLLSTGTGLAPFLSLIKDPDLYDRYDRIVLVHGVRETAELAYDAFISRKLPAHEFLGEAVTEKLIYYPTVTREAFRNRGRLSDLLFSGKLSARVGLPRPTPADDRFMLCGSPAMLDDVTRWLRDNRYEEGSHVQAGQFVIEKAFVEK